MKTLLIVFSMVIGFQAQADFQGDCCMEEGTQLMTEDGKEVWICQWIGSPTYKALTVECANREEGSLADADQRASCGDFTSDTCGSAQDHNTNKYDVYETIISEQKVASQAANRSKGHLIGFCNNDCTFSTACENNPLC